MAFGRRFEPVIIPVPQLAPEKSDRCTASVAAVMHQYPMSFTDRSEGKPPTSSKVWLCIRGQAQRTELQPIASPGAVIHTQRHDPPSIPVGIVVLVENPLERSKGQRKEIVRVLAGHVSEM
ncbi:hypothetical protein SCD_n00234 [Sulfuricella denitrificans skB26]|uniref:Uncharacterized protein n=1 Tax=Sulfuricella denitrificans (strain DSM 22764 / NBRC 105220 / skB26) TaxID=1163617 RepID=S6AAU8_SULDS|nr:hypothetical protein SCD_n00234 [Sulfuricella denitrificans skB26]